MNDILIDNFLYDLPEDMIAKYPLEERDNSRLLLYNGGEIGEDSFKNLSGYLGDEDILVFNNSRVVRARLIMSKESGAQIEVFCLEPLFPTGFESNLTSNGPVKWKCLIGNLRKWKTGAIYLRFPFGKEEVTLTAEKIEKSGESWIIEFAWDNRHICFSEILESAGKVPIPPYLQRKEETGDIERYQTIYCKNEGSVAAPTAGLHFTSSLLSKIEERRIQTEFITLHVSAGTFRPVKSADIKSHEMHTEHFTVSSETTRRLKEGRVIAVGTTTMRTLESLYWIGVSLIDKSFNPASTPFISQWEPYRPHRDITAEESLEAVASYIDTLPSAVLNAKTSLMIVPGYRFRIVKGLVTNFHLPGSTLLLLVAAFTGEKWREVYEYALNMRFRFLSYGDSSLLIP